ncbi:MAG: FkbM family methyltransferase [Phycisphaeraceae bacterium]|nr:FkbM family methyltransferase [Phycisphaeraceae bacterium]
MAQAAAPPDLYAMLGRKAPVLDIIDVGAMDTGDAPPYAQLLRPGLFRLVGFEPIPEECAKLNARARPGQTFLPHFIGDGGEHTFHLNAAAMTSSLLATNHALVDRFHNLGELMRTVSSRRVATRRLDDIPELTRADFLKADVQGAELQVFRGGRRLLERALVVETEVEFVPLYKDQPLFGDIDAELRAAGMLFHTFTGFAGRAAKPVLVRGDPNLPVRQFLWSNAVYVRDFTRWAGLDADDLLRIALILHHQYGSYDLAALALLHHRAKGQTDLWTPYLTRLTGAPPQPPSL